MNTKNIVNASTRDLNMDEDGIMLSIQNGPSRSRLIDAFKYAYDREGDVELFFNVVDVSQRVRRINIDKIISLEHEDGSGYCYNVEGYCDAINWAPFNEDKVYSFSAYYDAKAGEGCMLLLAKYS